MENIDQQLIIIMTKLAEVLTFNVERYYKANNRSGMFLVVKKAQVNIVINQILAACLVKADVAQESDFVQGKFVFRFIEKHFAEDVKFCSFIFAKLSNTPYGEIIAIIEKKIGDLKIQHSHYKNN